MDCTPFGAKFSGSGKQQGFVEQQGAANERRDR
jgi:hypothetical protein